MKVQVNYKVPVSATIDLDEATIDEILVWPTGIERGDGEHDFLVAGTQLPASLEQRARAREIADSQRWPAWDVA